MITPEKNQMETMTDAHPMAMVGTRSFRMNTTRAPISPAMERIMPRFLAMRRGTMLKPMMLDQRLTRLLNV